MLWFGVALGLLTALSTFAGTASTLIGLLIALTGGSFVAWYRGQSLTEKQVGKIVKLMQKLAIGLLIGLSVGFACRFVDQAAIQPWLEKKNLGTDSPVDEVAKELVHLQLFVLQAERKRLEAKESLNDEDFLQAQRAIELATEKSVAAPVQNKEKPRPDRGSVFDLQTVATQKLPALVSTLNDQINDSDNESVKEALTHVKVFLSEWTQIRQNSKQWLPLVEAALNDDDSAKSVFNNTKPLLDGDIDVRLGTAKE